MKSTTFIFALAILASTWTLGTACAATVTSSFAVTATVLDNCSISSPAITSQRYSAVTADPNSAVSVHCTGNTPYNVSLSAAEATSQTPLVSASTVSTNSHSSATAHSVSSSRQTVTESASTSASSATQALILQAQRLEMHPDNAGLYPDSVLITVAY